MFADRASVRRERWRALGFAGEPTADPLTSPGEAQLLRRAADRVPSAVAVAAEGVRQGAHAGMQLYVSHHGVTQAEAAVGWATGDAVMSTRTMLPWFCAMQPLFVLGFGRLWEAGELELRQPVHEVVPEFAGGGKEALSFWHLLTHTAGLAPDPFYEVLWGSREEFLAAVWRAELPEDMTPGAQAYYSQFWAWAVLAEAFERRTGVGYAQFLREEVLGPLGVEDCVLEVTDDLWERDGHRIGPIYDAESDLAPRLFAGTEDRWQFGAFAPGATGVGSAGAMGRIAEAFLPHPPRPVLSPQTVAAICARHRVGMWDEHWSAFLSWGLGVVADGWLFGSHCSATTIGHIGFNTSFFCVDPAHEVVVAGIANGLCGSRTSANRDRGVTDGVYRDLGIPRAVRPAPRVVAVDPPAELGVVALQARAEARFWNPNRRPTTVAHIAERRDRSEPAAGGLPTADHPVEAPS